MHRKPFRLNRKDKKVLGVCAGIADHFEVDVTLVRVGMALAIFMTFPIVLIGYFVLAALVDSGPGRSAEPRPEERKPAPRLTEASLEATRQRMRDLDARMQAIEAQVISSNTELAREIDALR